MNYKERYKEALERAAFYNNELLTENQRKMLVDIFPELTMSEDEKMKDYIKDVIQAAIIPKKENKQKMIAWLEKQGKKLDADYVIEWLDKNAPKWLYDTVYPIRLDVDAEDLIKQFKKDFDL